MELLAFEEGKAEEVELIIKTSRHTTFGWFLSNIFQDSTFNQVEKNTDFNESPEELLETL